MYTNKYSTIYVPIKFIPDIALSDNIVTEYLAVRQRRALPQLATWTHTTAELNNNHDAILRHR